MKITQTAWHKAPGGRGLKPHTVRTSEGYVGRLGPTTQKAADTKYCIDGFHGAWLHFWRARVRECV